MARHRVTVLLRDGNIYTHDADRVELLVGKVLSIIHNRDNTCYLLDVVQVYKIVDNDWNKGKEVER